MTTRRGFLGTMLAAAMAPAVVQSSSLMKIVVPKPLRLILHGDGIHDDTLALQTLFYGGVVMSSGGVLIGANSGKLNIPKGEFLISEPLRLNRHLETENPIVLKPSKPLQFLIGVEPFGNQRLSNFTFGK